MSSPGGAGGDRPIAPAQHRAPSNVRRWPRKVVVAPDSFKGSASAPAVADAIAEGLARVWPEVAIVRCPMADGGEGTLDAILACGGTRRLARVRGAGGHARDATFGLLESSTDRTAVIEVAQVVGITDTDGMSVPVEQRSTLGVGDLIRMALNAGAGRLMIGLGGSSTNDGGAGLLAGLGARLLDAAGAALPPTPEGLAGLATIDLDGFDRRLHALPITIMSDVNNPLCGERGATAIFGPQKGVARERVATLDALLGAYADHVERAFGRTAREQPGAGAAGGLGFALQVLGAEFRSGAEVVADLVGLDAALAGADLLVTGEGRTDRQTLLGKAPYVAARRAARAGALAVLLSGAVDRDALAELAPTFAGCFSLVFGPSTLERCIADAPAMLADSAEQLARFAGGVAGSAAGAPGSP